MRKQLRVIIAGSREFNDYDALKYICDYILPKRNDIDITIISGTARGADILGERYAREKGYSLIQMPAKWDMYGKAAGYYRNYQMAMESLHSDKAALIAFWNGTSKGTRAMIDIARNRNIDVYIVDFKKHKIDHIKPEEKEPEVDTYSRDER